MGGKEMKDAKMKTAETEVFPDGFEIDLDEAWRKVPGRQFGGDPGRGMAELIQNTIDSYPEGTPVEECPGDITTGKKRITITDSGEGMDRQRLKFLVTLGGTDKRQNSTKIGAFGIGFFSIFDPRLGTKKVTVTTRCEGHLVEMVFLVEKQDKRPDISTRFLQGDVLFSTRIDVCFDNNRAVRRCIEQAEKSLRYYPHRFLIDGNPAFSIWHETVLSAGHTFKNGGCHGFLASRSEAGMTESAELDILCKYEHIMTISMRSLIVPRHALTYDLEDYHSKEVPFLPGVSATINSNYLSVTIGRDSFYMDQAYRQMLAVITSELLDHLGQILDRRPEPQLILSNQYVLRRRIKDILDGSGEKSNPKKVKKTQENAVIRKLAEAKVYRLNGRRKVFSLIDIQALRSPDLPVYISPLQINLRWLGGAFKHDFIVLPPVCKMGGGAKDFHDTLFGELFGDVVNLDTIRTETEKITGLVKRGIVDKAALSPVINILRHRKLTPKESEILGQIDRLLNDREVMNAITEHLHLHVKRIRSTFFDVEDDSTTIVTGLFDEEGKALMEQAQSNLEFKGDPIKETPPPANDLILLGLSRKHHLIQHLIESRDLFRAYYALTFLAHELSLCQSLLVPNSPFYHFTKERLAAGMRRALMGQLLPGASGTDILMGGSSD